MVDELDILTKKLEERNIKIETIFQKLENFKIATPSWGYSEGGTRFHVFRDKFAARDLMERLEDAAQVNKFTGIAPEVAIHIPWDKVDTFNEIADYSQNLGLKITAINPNLFQEEEYKFGSITNSKIEIREKAIGHIMECIDIGRILRIPYLSLWFADGTNFPGQGDFIKRKKWMLQSLREVYSAMPDFMSMLLEYKFFEPAFYHTDLPDWGQSYIFCKNLGERAKVLVDLGHHPQGTNIEFIVANLIDEDILGGFHLNCRKYGDDDLTTGSLNIYELFLIFQELIKGNADDYRKTAFMLDQSHNIKPKIEAMIQSVISTQEIYTKALTIDNKCLEEAQENQDIIRAESCLKEAFFTDVSSILLKYREDKNIPKNPLKMFIDSGYKAQISKKRNI